MAKCDICGKDLFDCGCYPAIPKRERFNWEKIAWFMAILILIACWVMIISALSDHIAQFVRYMLGGK